MGARNGFAADLAAAARAALGSPSFEEGEALRKSRLEPPPTQGPDPATEVTTEVTTVVPKPTTEVTTEPTTVVTTEVTTVVPGEEDNKLARVLDYLLKNNPCKLPYKELGPKVGMSPFTARDKVYILRDRQWLTVEKWRNGAKSGVLIRVYPDKIPPGYDPTTVVTTVVGSVASSVVPPAPLLNREIPRQNLSISLSEETRRNPDAIRLLALTREDVNENWPCLLGMLEFGPDQIAECVENLLKVGKPLGLFTKGMDHGEWELANTGKLLAAKGQPPEKGPANYFFGAMKKSGYFRAPEGYVSPEQQALLDEQAEAKKLAAIAAAIPKPPKEPSPWELKTQEDIPMAVAWGEALPEVEVQRLFRTPRLPKDKVQLVTVWRQEGCPEPQLPPEEEI